MRFIWISLILFSSLTAIWQVDLLADWKYIGSSDEAGFSRPLFRSIALSTDKPDFESRVIYRGKAQRYALLRYGTADSLRVVIVVDEVSRRDFDLYVDANRDRTVTAAEKVDGTGRLRHLELHAILSAPESGLESLPRRVVFRRGITSQTIAFATLGFSEGSVSLDGRRLRARRVDGDGDGFFSTARDRVWFDLDDNGKWDAFAEQFPYLPILQLNGERYAVRGDLPGKRLDLRELTETGTVRLAIEPSDSEAQIAALDVMLVGADGSAVSLQGTEQAVSVPVGTYSVHTVRFAVKDSKTGTPWNFVFSDVGDQESRRVFDIRNDQEVSIDPIGKLRFELDHANVEQPLKPGSALSVQPRLYTTDGLLINSSTRGPITVSSDRSNAANIFLRDEHGSSIASTVSGFA